MLHMLPGPGSELGNAVAEDPNIDMISFTGSIPVGRNLSEAAGRNFKKMVSELGGNNAFVVLVDAGARIVTGGTAEGLFLRPTVLAEVTPDMPAPAEEIFGPVAVITTVHDDDEAVRLANATPYGLVAGVHSGSAQRAQAVGERLRAGMVHINDQTVDDETPAPFGGIGESGGSSRFGPLTNLDEFTVWQWMRVRDTQSHPSL